MSEPLRTVQAFAEFVAGKGRFATPTGRLVKEWCPRMLEPRSISACH